MGYNFVRLNKYLVKSSLFNVSVSLVLLEKNPRSWIFVVAVVVVRKRDLLSLHF